MSTRNITPKAPAALQPGARGKVIFTCPFCQKPNADYRGKPRDGWWIACWSCSALGLDGGDYLQDLKDEVGAPSASALLDDAPRWLGYLATGPPSGRVGRKEPLPSPAAIKGYASRLATSPEALRWLREERGLSSRVIRRARLGYDGKSESIVFPMYDGVGGELVAAKRRKPEAGAQMKAWAGKGRAWPLYPSPPEKGPVLLVAGELDALAARSHGLPACSVTLGAGYWRGAWTDQLRSRDVFLCFDNNEQEAAWHRVDALHDEGVEVQWIGLHLLGLRTRKGDLSDFLGKGRAKTLHQILNKRRTA